MYSWGTRGSGRLNCKLNLRTSSNRYLALLSHWRHTLPGTRTGKAGVPERRVLTLSSRPGSSVIMFSLMVTALGERRPPHPNSVKMSSAKSHGAQSPDSLGSRKASRRRQPLLLCGVESAGAAGEGCSKVRRSRQASGSPTPPPSPSSSLSTI